MARGVSCLTRKGRAFCAQHTQPTHAVHEVNTIEYVSCFLWETLGPRGCGTQIANASCVLRMANAPNSEAGGPKGGNVGATQAQQSTRVELNACTGVSWSALLMSCGGVAMAAALLFSNTLSAEFVWDDRAAILGNKDLLPSTPWGALWQHDFWGQNITLA